MLTFLLIKAVNLGLNGMRGVALAFILGPRSYGIFGTLIVIQQYMSYVALGVREGVAIKLARTGGAEEGEHAVIYSSALFWGACSALGVLGVLYLLQFRFAILADYFLWVWLISLLSILNEILININRHENKLRKVASLEFIYNAASLLLVAALWRHMTIGLALLATLAGLLIGVTAYFATVRPVSSKAISWKEIRELLGLGLLPAVLSAVLVVSNSLFVLVANWMHEGDAVGLIVFGNNVSVMILFGLNTIAWALASRSMKRLYVSPDGGAVRHDGEDLGELLLRVGIVASAALALLVQAVFASALQTYAASGIYVLYFCMFQAYGLLLFSETNFLNVNARLAFVLIGYLSMLALLVVLSLTVSVTFLQLVQIGVVVYFLLAVCITVYCRLMGLSAGRFGQRIAWLCFPVGCIALHQVAGNAGIAAMCAAYLAGSVVLYRERVGAYFAKP